MEITKAGLQVLRCLEDDTPMATKLTGGALKKVQTKLLNDGLIHRIGKYGFGVTKAGRAHLVNPHVDKRIARRVPKDATAVKNAAGILMGFYDVDSKYAEILNCFVFDDMGRRRALGSVTTEVGAAKKIKKAYDAHQKTLTS